MSKAPKPTLNDPWKKHRESGHWWMPEQLFPGDAISAEHREERLQFVHREEAKNEQLSRLVPDPLQSPLKAKLEIGSAYKLNQLQQRQERQYAPSQDEPAQETPFDRSSSPTTNRSGEDYMAGTKQHEKADNARYLQHVPEGENRRQLEANLEFVSAVRCGEPERAQQIQQFEEHRQKMNATHCEPGPGHGEEQGINHNDDDRHNRRGR